jgi:ribonuclease Z
VRELVVLGTGSQVATRERNQNGYFLRWDSDGFLFDPGEGTQRQMLYAGIAAGGITRLCVTHFHGDHCLGVPGVIQRLSLDDVPHPVHAHYPASGQRYFERLRYAASFYERAEVREEPVEEDGLLSVGPFGQLWARRFGHLTARQAARVARECGVRSLVLTHFSQRYTDLSLFREEAAAEFDGEIFVATDLARIPVPSRR